MASTGAFSAIRRSIAYAIMPADAPRDGSSLTEVGPKAPSLDDELDDQETDEAAGPAKKAKARSHRTARKSVPSRHTTTTHHAATSQKSVASSHVKAEPDDDGPDDGRPKPLYRKKSDRKSTGGGTASGMPPGFEGINLSKGGGMNPGMLQGLMGAVGGDVGPEDDDE